jgi:hypothetical protein
MDSAGITPAVLTFAQAIETAFTDCVRVKTKDDWNRVLEKWY